MRKQIKHINLLLLFAVSLAFGFNDMLHHHDGILHNHEGIAFESMSQHPVFECITCKVTSNRTDFNSLKPLIVVPLATVTLITDDHLIGINPISSPPLRAPPLVS